ncbi:hypothetical protein CC77DRAFT_488249 [Alternaria alternata]|uniref:Uncharacterized protein n=1 Tax=Alternaria alternata TaxID=5599 RepID=A0A177D652_ALTAL|nr:hypothetical protein CC77DRAFT_488249 [Alternaria alternata]KAH6849027.1 hypothetical protein B0T12DRAFT_203428 [Alternaria alternata]OAG15016.1 hypothetical protein CC77DRAFT_488249 [Alternaria alternata]
MLRIPSTTSAPNATSDSSLLTTSVEFDGIATFLAPSLERFTRVFTDSYHVEIVRLDKQVLLDRKRAGWQSCCERLREDRLYGTRR